jgi:conjugal transfer/type IV secretion protein DotA/TraY
MRKWIGGLLGSAVLLLTLFSATPAMAENIDQAAAEGYMTHIMSMPYDATDLADKSLVRLFGGFIFEPFGGAPGDPPTVLAKILGYTNIVAMILGVVIMGYVIMAGALNTAASGEMLGRSWSSVWLPLRTTLAFGMIMPSSSGEGTFSVAQSLVMWMIIVGSNSATWLWEKGAAELATGTPVMPTTVRYDSNAYTPVIDTVFCSAVRDKLITRKDKQVPVIGTLYKKDNDGNVTTSPLHYSQLSGLDLTDATRILLFGCGTINFAIASQSLDNTSLENADQESSGFSQKSAKWERALQTAYNKAVASEFKNVLTAAVTTSTFILDKNLNGKEIDSANSQGLAEATKMKESIEEGAVKYADVSKAFDTFYANVRTKTTAGGADAGWKESMTKGGWMRAGAWFFEASRLQGFVQTLLGGLDGTTKYTPTWALESTCRYNGSYSTCAAQNEEFQAWMTGMKFIKTEAAEKSQPQNTITRTGGVAKMELTTMADGDVKQLDENATDTISVNVAQTFIDALLWFGEDDVRGSSGSTGGNNSDNVTGMISPFTTVSGIGRGLQQITVTIWTAGLATAALLGLSSDPVAGTLASIFSGGAKGALAGMAQYMMGTLAPVVAGIGALAFMLAFAIPFMPVTVWIMLVCGYLVTVIEAVAAAPLAVIMLATPEGEGMSSGNFTKALQMVNAIILRPTLSIVGLFAAMTLSYAGFAIMNDLFWSVAKMTTDMSIFEVMALIFIYASLAFKVCEYMVSVIHKIPDQIMEWMGGGMSRPFGEDSAAADVGSSLKQNAGAAGITAVAGLKTAGGIAQQRIAKQRHAESLSAMSGKGGGEEPPKEGA